MVRRAGTRSRRDERVHDRRHRDGRCGHLLRTRSAGAGARRCRRPRRAGRVVGRHARRPAHIGQMAEAAHGRHSLHRCGPDVREIAMTVESDRLEHTIGIALRAGVTISSICLGAGLILALVRGPGTADVLLAAGVVILLATPVARVLISIIEYVREHDWTFVVLTAIVLIELMASAVAALVFNRRV